MKLQNPSIPNLLSQSVLGTDANGKIIGGGSVGVVKHVQVGKTANQTGGTAGTWTAIAWDAESNKTDAGLHSNSTNNTRLIAVVAGIHSISLSLRTNGTVAGSWETAIRRNGTEYWVGPAGSISQSYSMGGHWTLRMAASDYIEILMWNGATSIPIMATDTAGGTKATFTYIGGS